MKQYTIGLPVNGLQLVQLALQLGLDFSEGDHWRCMADERYDKALLLTTIMLFQWDAVAIPEHGEYMVQMSHDGFVKMLFRHEPVDRERLDEFLAAWKK